ncbi:hypothetical protein [Jiangella gansuensis]|uniref:hypothetical protein n=1 Tax=Jiangella gansuensis TaxID=281473 RepID=UPI0012FAD67F|nr:hypothetical protein [Jiangella gansuensis]
MSFEYYDTLHRRRAHEFERDARIVATARRLRRARRLEGAARRLQRLARRLEGRAGVSRARLL